MTLRNLEKQLKEDKLSKNVFWETKNAQEKILSKLNEDIENMK